jgi:citrate/tricarballylate utilization protein
VAAFILGFAACMTGSVLFGAHIGPGAFYQLMPHPRWHGCLGSRFSMRLPRWR